MVINIWRGLFLREIPELRMLYYSESLICGQDDKHGYDPYFIIISFPQKIQQELFASPEKTDYNPFDRSDNAPKDQT